MRPEDMVGQTLGHYRILRIIGYGGTATVFLAQDINLQREVALKVFWPRPGETRDFMRRFSREAQVLAQLDHPNILPVYDYGEQGGVAFLVMPNMPGGSLKDLLQQRKILPVTEAILLANQMLSALQYAYERGLIHRDIKPGNMLFKADGTLLLSDFGLVKVLSAEGENNPNLLEATAHRTGPVIAGTPEYMSPEQINGKAIPASDIYSMGIVLYEMLTGMRPFTAPNVINVLLKHVNEQPRPLREINPRLSPQLESVVLRALAKDPAGRYQRPLDFQQALSWAASFQGTSPLAGGPMVGGPTNTYATAQPPTNQLTASGSNNPNSLATRLDALPNSYAPVTGSYPMTPPPVPVPLAASAARPVTSPPPNLPLATPPTRRSRRLPFILVALILLVLAGTITTLALSPFGQGLLGRHPGQTPTATAHGTPGSTATAKPRATGTVTNKVTVTTSTGGATVSMPPTSTACPAAGTARAAVIAPLQLGADPTIIYIVNEGAASAPTAGTVKRYDTVTGKKVEVAKMPNTRIIEAQVSADGQWTLFTAQVAGQTQLRMVRMDGQGLQTLFCAPTGDSIRGAQWSLNQKLVVFDQGPSVGAPGVSLLNMTNGSVQTEVTAPSSGIAYLPRTWLDATRVLMIGFVPNSDATAQNLYLLDTTKGANQQPSTIQQLVTISQPCWDFDTNGDSTKLFVSQCTPGQNGSGTISSQPVSGGSQSNIFSSSTLAISSVRTVDLASTTLLFTVTNIGLGVTGDTSQDGLWKIKTDGSGLLRLSTDKQGESSTLNQFSQYFWSNLSRNNKMYALQTTNFSTNTYNLFFGSLSGGTPTQFASISGTMLAIAGWTAL